MTVKINDTTFLPRSFYPWMLRLFTFMGLGGLIWAAQYGVWYSLGVWFLYIIGFMHGAAKTEQNMIYGGG